MLRNSFEHMFCYTQIVSFSALWRQVLSGSWRHDCELSSVYGGVVAKIHESPMLCLAPVANRPVHAKRLLVHPPEGL